MGCQYRSIFSAINHALPPYLRQLLKHAPLLLQDLPLLADQRPLLLAQEPLQLPDLLLLALQGLHQLLLVLGELQLQDKRVL